MEYIDIIDENNNITGIKKEKEQAHKDGNFHRSVHIWILNNKNEILLQKRGPNQKYPNKWDVSSAGHVKAGESIIEAAKREVNEELGLIVEEKELEFIGINKSEKTHNKEFQYIYLYKTDKKENEFVFKDGEVTAVRYFSYEELKKIIHNKDENLHYTTKEEYELLFDFLKPLQF